MWLFFTLATTLLWGAAELFYKKGSHDNEKYGHLKVCILVGVVMGIHAIFTLLTQDVGFRVTHLIEYLPVSLCYIGSMALSFFGIRFIEESISDPIENTSGAMCTVLCALILGDEIAPMVWVAIAIIVVGITDNIEIIDVIATQVDVVVYIIGVTLVVGVLAGDGHIGGSLTLHQQILIALLILFTLVSIIVTFKFIWQHLVDTL